MKKDVMLVTGAGQISMALARRTGFGKKIVLGDKKIANAEAIAKIMNDAGYDVVPFEMDLSSRESIQAIIKKAQEFGEIKYMINGAGARKGRHRGHARIDAQGADGRYAAFRLRLLRLAGRKKRPVQGRVHD